MLLLFIVLAAGIRTPAQKPGRSSILPDTARIDSMVAYANAILLKAKYENTSATLNEALHLSRSIGDSRREADVLLSMAGVGFYSGNYDSAATLLAQAAKVAYRSGNEKAFAKAQKNLLMLYDMQGNEKMAQQLIDTLAIQLPSVKSKEYLGFLLYGIGNHYMDKDFNEIAINYFIKALGQLQSTTDSLSISNTLISIGSTYSNIGQKEKAHRYFYEAGRYVPAIPPEKNALYHALIHFSFAESWSSFQQPDSALYYYLKALPVFKSQDNRPYLCRTFLGIGKQQLSKGNLTEAAAKLNRALDIATVNNAAGNSLSGIYLSLGSLYKARNERATAITAYNRAIAASYQSEIRKDRMDAYINLSLVFEKAGNYKNALYYERAAKDLSDSIRTESNLNSIAEMELKYRSEQRENRIALLEKQNAIKDLNITNKNRAVTLLIIAAGLVTALAFLIIYRVRLKRLQKETAIRNRIASDLHDDVGSTLSSISLLTEMAGNRVPESDKNAALLKKTSADARRMMENMDDIVWSINPQNDEFKNLETRIKEYAMPLMSGKHIDFKVVFEDKIEDLKLSMEQRRELYLIIKESINNLVKYSDANTASLTFMKQKQGKNILIEIKDNGKGFNTEQAMATSRNGLKSMERRAAALKAGLNIKSKPSLGTTITLLVPQ